ncbi:MAG: NADH-quinone oxidoreductase subunit M [Fibrobacteraceae bacterium]|nr:NADH-quinone oxidoreductase subunit M [Fibrobacteraceae bacterium]
METVLFNLIWFLPLLAVLVCVPIPSTQIKTIKTIHVATESLILLLVGYLVYSMYTASGTPANSAAAPLLLHYFTDIPWLSMFNAHYIVGADALNILLLFLTAVIVWTGILVSWNIKGNQKVYFALIQLLATSVYGVFMSFDLVLFFVFYEMEALCMYLMIAGYGSGRKDYGGKKLTLTLALGSSMILATLFGFYFEGGIQSWSIVELSKVTLPMDFQMWAFPLLFMGFAVSSSLFPFHFWSPDGHSAAPTAVSMLAAGVMMKMGAYGCLRVAMFLMPEAAKIWLPYVVLLLIFNVVVGPFIAIRHKDLKYITAYSSISHLGLIFLGLAALTPVGLRGATLQMISHGFLTGLFFATIGMIYERTHTRDITQMGGIMRKMPFLGVGFVIAGFAGLGLPGFSGFIAESTIFIGAFSCESTWVRIVTILAILSITTTAVYILQTANRMLHGEMPAKYESLTDGSFREKLVIVILVLCLLFIGIFPTWISEFLDQSIAPIFENISRANITAIGG